MEYDVCDGHLDPYGECPRCQASHDRWLTAEFNRVLHRAAAAAVERAARTIMSRPERYGAPLRAWAASVTTGDQCGP